METFPERFYSVSVLIIDDDEFAREGCKFACRRLFSEVGEGLNLKSASNMIEALELLSQETFHVVLLDKDLGKDPDGNNVDGVDNIPNILELQPLTQILVLTADENPALINKGMQLGAAGYLLKTDEEKYSHFRDQEIKLTLAKALQVLKRERIDRLSLNSPKEEFVAISPIMKRLDIQLENRARVLKPILILGESGLGKTVVAKRLNQIRARLDGKGDRPFLNLNMASVSQDLVLSELFGTAANSFTGSGDRVKAGYFELANDGDIFLDEIGEASPDVQAKLLKVIEEREFQRLGGGPSLKTTARVILATNKNLKEMVQANHFRYDLYMRISAFTIEMPTLEERKEDLPFIVGACLRKACAEVGIRPLTIDDLPKDLMDYLCRDNIEGNIRGIENDLEQILISNRDKFGRPVLSSWRSAVGLSKRYSAPSQAPTYRLTLEHLLKFPTNVLGPDFPGLAVLKKIIEEKVLREAELKFPKIKDRADALKVFSPNLSRKYSTLAKDQSHSLEQSS